MTAVSGSARCRACGRRLLDPASRRAGLGPVCRARLTPAPQTPGQPDTRPTPGPGQLAIELPEPRRPHHPPVLHGRPVHTIHVHGGIL